VDEKVTLFWVNPTSNEFYWSYYHQDGLGNVVALTSNFQSPTQPPVVRERMSYDAFGRMTLEDANGQVQSASSYGNRFFFTGREYLAEVGTYDYRNRVYSAELGRFLQTDPIRFEAGDVNLVRYVGNRVSLLTDPLGLLPPGVPIELDPSFQTSPPGNSPPTSNLRPNLASAVSGLAALINFDDCTQKNCKENCKLCANTKYGVAVAALTLGGAAGVIGTNLFGGVQSVGFATLSISELTVKYKIAIGLCDKKPSTKPPGCCKE
jgi:RHS repeat-associated protein